MICEKALDGENAIHKIMMHVEKHGYSCYDFILMDCNMPNMDGYTATKKIREYLYMKNIRQPVITAVTGHLEQSYVEKAFKSGMN